MKIGLSHEKLHVIAMILMVIDHIGAVLYPSEMWLRGIGRLAFPIFCFMLVEGYFHTHDNKKYMLRILISAIISEIPFNYITWGTKTCPYQNVMWTLLIGLGCISLLEKIKEVKSIVLKVILNIIVVCCGYVLGQIMVVDYFGLGVLEILVFYYGRGNAWYRRLIQLIGVVYINYYALGGYCVEIMGRDVPVQASGILALGLIWLYNNKKELKGKASKIFQYVCYGFYPVHMIVLYMLQLLR